MSERRCKVIQVGHSLVVVLPKDWTRGQHIERGDTLKVSYDGDVVQYSSDEVERHG
jgi:antitoxin component of MazEF toxin-antitoxin module